MDDYITEIENDDNDLILALDCWLYGITETRMPSELFVIRVDNWFDHKWLGFAGQSKVTIDTGLYEINSEINAHWRTGTDVTIPPFSPQRILEESYFKKEKDKLVKQRAGIKLVHSLDSQRSSKNIYNRANDVSNNGLFIWLSSKSILTQRASMLLYRSLEDKLLGWYASFVKKDIWKVYHTKNMDRELFSRLFSNALKAMTT